MSATSMIVSDLDRARYATDGAICLRGLFTADEVALMKQGIERKLADPGPLAIVASKPEDPGFFIEDFCNWQRFSEYETIIRHSKVAQAAAELTCSQTVRFFHDHLLVKEPRTAQRTPWHQDQPYYNVEGRQNVSVWIPVDPVPKASSLEMIAGTHLGPWYMPRSFKDQQAKWFQPGELQDLPDIASNPDAFPILSWALEPGDAVCFNMLTLHGSAGVSGSHRRRVLSLRFLGDDMRHAPRRWATSPDFPGLTHELAAGAPMDHPLFPVVWSQG